MLQLHLPSRDHKCWARLIQLETLHHILKRIRESNLKLLKNNQSKKILSRLTVPWVRSRLAYHKKINWRVMKNKKNWQLDFQENSSLFIWRNLPHLQTRIDYTDRSKKWKWNKYLPKRRFQKRWKMRPIRRSRKIGTQISTKSLATRKHIRTFTKRNDWPPSLLTSPYQAFLSISWPNQLLI